MHKRFRQHKTIPEADAYVLAGKFFDIELPKQKKYLYKYFKTPLQRHFLNYIYWNNIFPYYI